MQAEQSPQTRPEKIVANPHEVPVLSLAVRAAKGAGCALGHAVVKGEAGAELHFTTPEGEPASVLLRPDNWHQGDAYVRAALGLGD